MITSISRYWLTTACPGLSKHGGSHDECTNSSTELGDQYTKKKFSAEQLRRLHISAYGYGGGIATHTFDHHDQGSIRVLTTPIKHDVLPSLFTCAFKPLVDVTSGSPLQIAFTLITTGSKHSVIADSGVQYYL